MLERLQQEMDRLNINARELSIRANLGGSFVYDILSGKSSNPTIKKMSAIADALGISLPYLLSGIPDDARYSSNIDFIKVPILSSTGKINNDTINYLFQEKWLIETLSVATKDLKIFVITGDNMQPTLNNGDTVLVNISCKAPTKPGIFLILSGASMVPRNIEFLPDKNFRKICISDNLKLSNHICNLDEVDIIGQVIWVAREI